MQVTRKSYTYQEACQKYHMYCESNCFDVQEVDNAIQDDSGLIRLLYNKRLVWSFMPETLQNYSALEVSI